MGYAQHIDFFQDCFGGPSAPKAPPGQATTTLINRRVDMALSRGIGKMLGRKQQTNSQFWMGAGLQKVDLMELKVALLDLTPL